VGLIGEQIFELTLQDIEVPYVRNNPIIDWRGIKRYDFRIPTVETVEIKTVDWKENQRRVIINCEEWHNSDYMLALKLSDVEPKEVKFMGIATCKDVLEKFEHAKNEQPCLNDPCYWQYLDKLDSASHFFKMLIDKTSGLWKRP